jgi:hypothetical protein
MYFEQREVVQAAVWVYRNGKVNFDKLAVR